MFWIFFGLMLLSCLVISLLAFATTQDFDNDGRGYFFAYDVCLSLVQFFVIPYSAYRSMSRERDDETCLAGGVGAGEKAAPLLLFAQNRFLR